MRFLTVWGLLAGSVSALAWGPEGHRLVSRIAWEQMTPMARERVTAILKPDETIISQASWADEVRRTRRETEPWHYIDIPVDGKLDMARDCPKNECVITKIEEFEKALRDPSLDADHRREALLFLVHFIEDLSQPLHSTDRHDRGGNDVHVQFGDRQSNLHSLWDSGLLGRMPKEDELFPELLRESERRAKKFEKGTVEDWAMDSHKQCRKIVYGKLPKVTDPKATVTIDQAYEHTADEVVKVQLEKGGARLAYVLNRIFR